MLILYPALLGFELLILSIDILQTGFNSVFGGNNIFFFKFYKIKSKPVNMFTVGPHGFNGVH